MTIHQEVTIPASPTAVFEVLTSSDKFAAMTGGRSADISTEEGGAFSMFGGDIGVATFFVQAGYPLGAGAELTNALQVTIGQ